MVGIRSAVDNRGNNLTGIVKDHPDEIADWLEDNGITATELREEIYQRTNWWAA